jgi:Icc-related predicted phosphoesterase
MRILFFSDTHGINKWHEHILKQSKLVDLIVCAGDFTIFEENMRHILELFNSIHKPVLIIHGNHETATSIIREIHDLKNITFIHKEKYVFENLIFFGYGGGGFSSIEENFDRASDSFIKDLNKIEKNREKEMKIILVTHAPPYNTKLDYLGDHVGVINYREFIEKYQPIYAVSGHIHENFEIEDKIEKTILLNIGPRGKIIEF